MSHSTSLIVQNICPSLLDAGGGHLLLGPDCLLKTRTHPAWSRLFYLFLHLEVSSWTWVGQTGVNLLMSYDRFRAYKFALNVCTFLWHIFYLFCEKPYSKSYYLNESRLAELFYNFSFSSPALPEARAALAMECLDGSPSRDHSSAAARADCSKRADTPSSKDGQNFPGHFRLKFDFVLGLGMVCFMNCSGLD